MTETIVFPNTVGCDIHRAKLMISQKLHSNYYFFREVYHKANRKNSSKLLEPQQLNEIILYIDEKYNCIAKTPSWTGIYASSVSERQYLEDDQF